MKKISILTCLALFAATLTQQGAAWAQGSNTQNSTTDDDWGQVPTVTSAWTHLTAGSTTGFELADDYYYVSENLTFTNTSGGAGQGSGMYVQAGREVHLYIPVGVTLTAIGADGDGNIGGGAGILLPESSTLYIHGGGTLVATGGNAANGEKGSNGTDAVLDDGESVATWFLGKKIYCGRGGAGGNGGGGAGAGIGTAGGNGGAGGVMTATPSESYADWQGGDLPGVTGVNGNAGQAADEMGTLYIQSAITQQITGGAKGNGGAAGQWGNVSITGGEIEFSGVTMVQGIPIPTFDVTDYQGVAGGGGGGGGAGGGSAQAIGTGGSGGGGGASGAHGSACAHNATFNSSWPSVGAGGGAGGVGTESNNGADGATCWFQGEDNIFDDEDNHKPGGKGGAAGAASVAGTVSAATPPSYTVSYYAVGTTPGKDSEEYNVGSGTTITLPSLSGGDHVYKWILSIHGHAAGATESHCAAPNGDVYSPGDEVNLSNIYGAIEFCAVYVGCDIDCTDHTNNYLATALANYTAHKYAVVKLTNRKLYRDGYWNTLTLPFSLSAKKLAETCLAGADIRTFQSADYDGGEGIHRLTINFSPSNEGKIDAGVPCIIRWGTPGNAPGDIINDPIFTNVAVNIQDQSVFEDDDEYNHYETTSSGLRFQAQIAPVQLSADSNTLLLGSNNRIYRPDKSVWVHATHAYFTYGDPIHHDEPEQGDAREIVMDFGNGEQETTYIDDIRVNNAPERTIEGIFNLSGQRLDAPRKGINIINGKKVVIK